MDSPRLRVLVTAFAAVPGSSPHGPALLAMASALRADLDMVTVKTEQLSHVEKVGDARMFRVPVGESGPLEQRVVFDRAVARQLAAEQYDVVHVRGPFEGAIAALAKEQHGYRFLYEMATFPDEALGAEVERRWAEAHATCVELADRILVPSEAARRALGEHQVPPERIVVLPPGVDVGLFDWKPAPTEGYPRLLYVGAFTTDRDLATMLRAIRRVSRTREVRMLIAGETDRSRRERLRKMVESFELEEVIEVRGEPPPRSLPQIIAAADLCLAPASEAPRFQSLGDLPQPLLEYLACQRPVIAAGVPGVSDIVRDEQEGLLYPPGDESALADAILMMLRDTKLRDRTVESGYRRVRELFSSGARRRRIVEIYERLAPGSQDADPWAEAFEDAGTGMLKIASAISDQSLHTDASAAGDTLVPERPSTGERIDTQDVIELEPGEALVIRGPTHEITRDVPARIDTEPGMLAAESTQLRRPSDTDPGR